MIMVTNVLKSADVQRDIHHRAGRGQGRPVEKAERDMKLCTFA